MKRIGFVINSRVPAVDHLFQGGLLPHHLMTGWDDSASPMSFMRFRWIANELGRTGTARYELYKPWRNYDAVVFLKSMGGQCLDLATHLRKNGVKIIFEANVDYYTEASGEARFEAAAPTAQQRVDAIAMTKFSDKVIASSRHLAEICSLYSQKAQWVPDNIPLNLISSAEASEPIRDGKLQVWWSGMAAKLCDFLAIEESLLRLAGKIHLHFVTSSLEAMQQWGIGIRERFEALITRVPHSFHSFHSVPRLLDLYKSGGIIVSPRFLDTPYNLGHTEWKITLGMACGLPAVVSPVPSYQDVADRSGDDAIRICSNEAAWDGAFEELLSRKWNLEAGGAAAREVVMKYYATEVVAPQHWNAVQMAMENSSP